MAIALVAVLALYFEHLRRPSAKMAALGIATLLGAALVASGSRGAILSAGGGLFGLTLVAGAGRKPLRRVALIGTIAAIGVLALFSSEMMRHRFEEAAEGKLARRERIYPAAWGMIREHPLVGWGPADANYSLAVAAGEYGMGRRVGDERITPHKRDFHNLPLDLLGTVGLAGAVPMALCLGMCGWFAWIGRRGREGAGPIALLIVTLLLSLSGNRILSKQTWIVFAYAYVSGYAYRGTRVAPAWPFAPAGTAVRQPRVVPLRRSSNPLESQSRRAAR
jgi:O-antigen ligase